MLEQFREWLANNRRFLFSRFTKDSQETQEPERTLIQLPDAIRQKLVDRIESLPSNPEDQKAIAEKFDEAFECWRDNPNSNNSLVVLSSPVTAVSRILAETLENWKKKPQLSVRLLAFEARPELADTIQDKLQHYLEDEFATEAAVSHRSEIIIIPNLSWCFLRSLEGLDGIEYLQQRLYDGFADRFWIIGSGQVGWEYLNSVSNIEAYCGEVFTLPALTPEQLQDWFEPIVEELNITFEDPRIDRQILKGDKDNKTHYFERLADISQGVSTVAVQGFLKSIRYQEADEERDIERSIVAETPKLPDLPELESTDLYILYSILLHGDLTISALAESLGDKQSTVQAKVRLLRHQGIIEQRDRTIKINPSYYPNIKRELASNNFVIDKH